MSLRSAAAVQPQRPLISNAAVLVLAAVAAVMYIGVWRLAAPALESGARPCRVPAPIVPAAVQPRLRPQAASGDRGAVSVDAPPVLAPAGSGALAPAVAAVYAAETVNRTATPAPPLSAAYSSKPLCNTVQQANVATYPQSAAKSALQPFSVSNFGLYPGGRPSVSCEKVGRIASGKPCFAAQPPDDDVADVIVAIIGVVVLVDDVVIALINGCCIVIVVVVGILLCCCVVLVVVVGV